jgi:hypothetical protein
MVCVSSRLRVLVREFIKVSPGNTALAMGSGASRPSAIATHLSPLSNFYTIANNFQSFIDLQNGLKAAGLESSELIIGIDFTKSNLYNGTYSFGGKSLHHLSSDDEPTQNPYEYVLNNICQTMAAFDDDNQIPCFGFGDVTTRNQKVFSFQSDLGSCSGLREVQSLYRELLPNISLAGPTSFAPIIRFVTFIGSSSRSSCLNSCSFSCPEKQFRSWRSMSSAIMFCESYSVRSLSLSLYMSNSLCIPLYVSLPHCLCH